MRSAAVLAATALAFVANAQSSAEAPAPSGVSEGAAEASAAAKEITDCLKKCDDDDSNCRASCIAVPSPNDDQMNDLIECSAECDQGDGSPSDTEAFAQCLDKCREENFFEEGTGTPRPSGAPAPGGNNSDDSDSATASAPAGNTASETGASAAPSASGDASGTSGDDEASSTGDADSASESGESDEEDNEESGANMLAVSASFGVVGVIAAFLL